MSRHTKDLHSSTSAELRHFLGSAVTYQVFENYQIVDFCNLEQDRCSDANLLLVTDIPPAKRRRARHKLFDYGFFQLITPPALIPGPHALFCKSVFVLEEDVISLDPSHTISMTRLGKYGRFANQLFQYGFLMLYSIRHDCRIETPAWRGEIVFDLKTSPITRRRPVLESNDGSFGPLVYWELDEPLRDVDMVGHFQCLPQSFRYHRTFLRRLFTPVRGIAEPIERWLEASREGGRRIVGIHVRRGDYLPYDPNKTHPHSQVPIAWYRSWLIEHFASHPMSLLHVATDDPEVVGAFRDFPLLREQRSAPREISADILDFFTLRQADIVLIANSSWSRMAGLLNERLQEAWIVNFEQKRFLPYVPWDDLLFWPQFGYSQPNLVDMSAQELRTTIVNLWVRQSYFRHWLRQPIRWLVVAAVSRLLASVGFRRCCELVPSASLRTRLLAQHERACEFLSSFSASGRRRWYEA